MKDERYEYFLEQWEELKDEEKLRLFQEYCSEVGCDDEIYDFDDEFFNIFFEGKPMEAVRAAHFGNINCWNDDYIKFNAYGNLESLSIWQAVDVASSYTKEIYELDEFDDYIDMSEYDCPEEDEEEED